MSTTECAVAPRVPVVQNERKMLSRLAFGSGIHLCASMNVARLEAHIALERFLARFPDYQMDREAVRSPRARFRGFVSLPLRVR
jgi:cytochrome P450